MTVHELVERLETLPQDVDVWVRVLNWDCIGQLEGIDVWGAGKMVVLMDTADNVTLAAQPIQKVKS